MKKTLIVVDMLNDFCHPNGVLAKSPITDELYAKPIVPYIKKLVDEFRENNDDIIWLCDSHDKNDKEFDRFPSHAVRETWGAEIIDELNPKKAVLDADRIEYMVEKTRYSGFYNTDLEYVIDSINPDETIVVGVCTSICVMDTIGGLSNRDYSVTVIKDGVADFDPDAHKSSLKRMENLYGAKIV